MKKPNYEIISRLVYADVGSVITKSELRNILDRGIDSTICNIAEQKPDYVWIPLAVNVTVSVAIDHPRGHVIINVTFIPTTDMIKPLYHIENDDEDRVLTYTELKELIIENYFNGR